MQHLMQVGFRPGAVRFSGSHVRLGLAAAMALLAAVSALRVPRTEPAQPR